MSRLEVIDDVVVFSPDREDESRALAGERPRVAFFEPPPPQIEIPLLFGADAYVTSDVMLGRAMAWVKSEDRTARTRGPWRVVFVGALGVGSAKPFGESAPVGERLVIGRSQGLAMVFPSVGTIARANTSVSIVNGRPLIQDLRSTNGTRVHGREFVIGLGHHLRVDGGE